MFLCSRLSYLSPILAPSKLYQWRYSHNERKGWKGVSSQDLPISISRESRLIEMERCHGYDHVKRPQSCMSSRQFSQLYVDMTRSWTWMLHTPWPYPRQRTHSPSPQLTHHHKFVTSKYVCNGFLQVIISWADEHWKVKKITLVKQNECHSAYYLNEARHFHKTWTQL